MENKSFIAGEDQRLPESRQCCGGRGTCLLQPQCFLFVNRYRSDRGWLVSGFNDPHFLFVCYHVALAEQILLSAHHLLNFHL